MNILNVRRLTPSVKAVLVIACAIMTGFMWRARGTHGYGSMWGMFAVGVMLVLFIFAFFGNRKKMSLEMIPLAVILLGITNGGWGTLNSQMGGYLISSVPFTGQETDMVISISPWSGLAVMLLLGFGWMPLFSMFIGTLFSKKQYKIWNYLVLISVFYAVVYIFQFFVAHYILPYITPEAVEAFKEGLADRGFDYTPIEAYIKELGSEAWFKKIPFGRNYFASIRVVSYSAGALVLSLGTLIFKRDAVTAFISFMMNLICSVSITVADFAMIIDSDAGFLGNVTPPRFLENGSWSLWEYLTGFFLGFGIMLLLVCLPKSITGGEGDFDYAPPIKNRKLYAFYSAVLTLFATFVVTVARPMGLRIAELMVYKGIVEDEDIPSYIIIAIVCVIGMIPCAIITHKNIIKKEMPNLLDIRTEDFCLKAVPVYFAVVAFLYFIFGESNIFNCIPYDKITSPTSIIELIWSGEIFIPVLMIISLILFYIVYIPLTKMAVRKK